MTETEKINLFGEAIFYIARLWLRIMAPVTYTRVCKIDGERVRVTIEREDAETPDRTSGARVKE